MSFFVTEEAIHLPPAPDPDMVGVFSRVGTDESLGARAQEWKGRRREKAWEKKGESYLLIRAVNIERHPTRLKIRLLPRAV